MPVRHSEALTCIMAFRCSSSCASKLSTFSVLVASFQRGMWVHHMWRSQCLYDDDRSMLQQLLWISIILDSTSLIIYKTTVNIHSNDYQKWALILSCAGFTWPMLALSTDRKRFHWSFARRESVTNMAQSASHICIVICEFVLASPPPSVWGIRHGDAIFKARRLFMESFCRYLSCRSLFYCLCRLNTKEMLRHQNPNPNLVSISNKEISHVVIKQKNKGSFIFFTVRIGWHVTGMAPQLAVLCCYLLLKMVSEAGLRPLHRLLQWWA